MSTAQRHDPTFMSAGRWGTWATCSCRWQSATYTTISGAVLAHGEHLLLEQGRRLASRRDDLIAAGVDPADLEIPLAPLSPREATP